MKNLNLLFALIFLALAGCTTTTTRDTQPEARTNTKPKPKPPLKDPPETVLITYHVKPGMEPVFGHLLYQAWQAYRKEHLVLAEPHFLIRQVEEGGRIGYVELFTWVDHSAPDRTSPEIKEIWSQEKNLCETRGGHAGLSGGEVELIVPARK